MIKDDVKVGDLYKKVRESLPNSEWKIGEVKRVVDVSKDGAAVRFENYQSDDKAQYTDLNSMISEALEPVVEYYTWPTPKLPEGWEDWDGKPVAAWVWDCEERKRIRIVTGIDTQRIDPFCAQSEIESNLTVDELEFKQDNPSSYWDHAERIPRNQHGVEITLGGKTTTISRESYEALKKLLCEE
jgi:hypothetical protein